MATPMTPDRLVQVLRDEGLKVVEYKNWRTNNRNHKGLWGPVHGVVVHHTVTKGTAHTVELCYSGHSTLPGPLCQIVIAKDGTVYLVGNGRANHAGSGDGDVFRAVVNEIAPLPAANEADWDGNRHFYGLECENLGDGKDPWPTVQLAAIEKTAAAICREHGWTHRSVIGHKEWQPGKVDPRGFSMDWMREIIEHRLSSNPTQEDDMPLSKEDIEKVADAVIRKIGHVWSVDVIPAARPPHANEDYQSNPTWSPKYAIQTTIETGRQTLGEVQKMSKALTDTGLTDAQMDALADKLLDKMHGRLQD